MTEDHIGLLFKAATLFSQSEFNESYKILKSHYLMRCKEITRGYGLPKKHFSEKVRCAFCCLEWNNKAETKVKSVKLSKQQRRRIRAKCKKTNLTNSGYLLYSNEMERTCSFCSRSIKIPLLKPNRPCVSITEENSDLPKESIIPKDKKKKVKPNINQQIQSNVYCKSNVAFSLNKNKNTLSSIVKEQPKMIKNNKKKKDKFAGLCQKAVIAATKLKQEKTKENKLNLFLKPSV